MWASQRALLHLEHGIFILLVALLKYVVLLGERCHGECEDSPRLAGGYRRLCWHVLGLFRNLKGREILECCSSFCFNIRDLVQDLASWQRTPECVLLGMGRNHHNL